MIRERALAVGIGAASVREIDRVNIYHATVLAMRRALARLARRAGSRAHRRQADPHAGTRHTAVVGGDDKCYAIACASIVAKVTRDRLMARLAARHPEYGWERNAGTGQQGMSRGWRRSGPRRITGGRSW